MIVDQLARSAAFYCDSDAALGELHFGDAAANDLRAAEAAAKRRADVARLQAAAGDLGQHRCEEQRIGVADQGERYGAVWPENLFEILRRGHAGETSAQDQDAFRWQRLGQGRLGFGAEPGERKVAERLADQAER